MFEYLRHDFYDHVGESERGEQVDKLHVIVGIAERLEFLHVLLNPSSCVWTSSIFFEHRFGWFGEFDV